MQLPKYRSVVFDCDGVILNANSVKTKAFHSVAVQYGEAAAAALVAYHVEHGGRSRYQKFEYFIRTVIGRDPEPGELDALSNRFAEEVTNGLMRCEVAPGLERLREATPNTRWLVVSGGDQAELRHVFSLRGLAELFDAGIFGSPASKEQILERELSNKNLCLPAVFLGDTRYDYEVARKGGLDFIFLYSWTEVKDWRTFFGNRPDVTLRADIAQILKLLGKAAM